MNRVDFLNGLKSPLPNAILKKWPEGNVHQFWSENPKLYAEAFGELEPIHAHLGGHTGIDISTFHRDPVYAAHDGYIKSDLYFTDRKRAGGLEVWVYSGLLDGEKPLNSTVATVYCHLDEIVVKPGERVVQGQLLGYEGNTGFVISGKTQYWGNAPAGVGTHLHFGLYELVNRDGTWYVRDSGTPMKGSIDPLPFISDPTPHDGKADGNLGGYVSVLTNMSRYLKYLFGSSS